MVVAFLTTGYSLLKKLVSLFKKPDIPTIGCLISRLFSGAEGTPLLANLTGNRYNVAAERWVFTENLRACLLGELHVAIEPLAAALLAGILTAVLVVILTCAVCHSILRGLIFVKTRRAFVTKIQRPSQRSSAPSFYRLPPWNNC